MAEGVSVRAIARPTDTSKNTLANVREAWEPAQQALNPDSYRFGPSRHTAPLTDIPRGWRVWAGYSVMIREPRLLIIDNNSRRVAGLSRNAPSIRLVTIVTPGLWTPRVVMH